MLRFDARGFEVGVCGDLTTEVGISMGGSRMYRLDILKLFGQFEKVLTNAVEHIVHGIGDEFAHVFLLGPKLSY
ncbi:hypothetical protein [Pseudomonas rossensis]|uniref:hypothetical protein n=1 Tax=Pseudomonas rossensis TaxID=2305471 RepID=UPI003260E85D